MKAVMMNFFLAGLLAMMSLQVSAQEEANALENREAFNEVVDSLKGGKTPGEIIDVLRGKKYGMSLSEATVFGMVSASTMEGGDAYRTAFATAGIEAADNLAQAQGVAAAVKATAGQSGKVAGAADLAVSEYTKSMPQPKVYEDNYTPTGGGVSDA